MADKLVAQETKSDDLLESLLKGFGVNLDITNQEIDPESLSEALRGSEEDTVIREALEKGINLREYCREIEEDAAETVWESIDDYIKEAENLSRLHVQIQESDSVLSKLGLILKEFEGDLGTVSADIAELQAHSNYLNMKLSNRSAVRDKLAEAISIIVVAPDLVKALILGDVNDSYIQHLKQFDQKLQALQAQKMQNNAVAALEVRADLELLRYKIVRKVRDFMIGLVYSLRKPKTNIQILQQNVLCKYSYLNKFLYFHEPLSAAEVRDAYVETVARTFTSYFRSYVTNLTKLQYQIADAADLLGADANKKIQKVKQSHKNRASVFSLSNANTVQSVKQKDAESPGKSRSRLNRMSILYEMESAPAIVPHVALQNGVKYSYEHLFRSIYRLLVDTVSSEQLFDAEWFPKQVMADTEQGLLFSHIFNRILGVLIESLQAYLLQCYDPIGILIMVLITRHSIQLMASRQIHVPPFIAYLTHIEGLLWDRFNHIMELNIDSVRNCGVKSLGTIDIRPTYVTRRYAELCASLHTLNARLRDQRVTAWLTVMRTAVERLLDRVSVELPDPRSKTVFLINNYDLILTVLREHELENYGFDIEDMTRIHYALNAVTGQFIEEELVIYYKQLITYVKETDSVLLKAPNTPISREQLEQLSKDFAGNWKEVLSNINTDVMNYFSNFQLGSEVLKKVLSQFVLYYKRFEEIHRKCFRSSSNPVIATTTSPSNTSPQSTGTSPPPTHNSNNNNNNNNNNTSNTATPFSARSFIPLSTITYEITKKYSTFTI